MATPPPKTFGPSKDRRKSAPVKRVTVSPETRKAYEDAIRDREQRDKAQAHLPDDMKGKR